MLKEFRDFALRGNAMDMAVGIIIGAAFTSIVNSLVNDIIMPPLGYVLGGVDFSNFYLTIATTAEGPVRINYGLFINAVISFLLVSLALFFLIRAINRLQTKKPAKESAQPTTKDCPFCFTSIPVQATRCPHCTSQLK